MQFIKYTSLSIAVIAVLSACSTTPPQIAALDEARTIVPQLESSARTGVAATNVSNARKSLDTANRLVDSGGKITDIEFEAQKAVLSAKIAQEKILTAQAQEEMEKGTAQRQVVLLESREREIERNAQNANRCAANGRCLQQARQFSRRRACRFEGEADRARTRAHPGRCALRYRQDRRSRAAPTRRSIGWQQR